MLDVCAKPVESILFHSDVVALGSFRCAAENRLFRDSGPCSYHTFAFPRTSTAIRHDNGVSFVGSPGTIVFYNQNQRYQRERVSPVDATDWFVVASDVLIDSVRQFDEAVADRPGHPFRIPVAPSSAKLYLEQRRLFERVEAGPVDAFAVEERTLAILDHSLAAAYARRPVTSETDSFQNAGSAVREKRPARDSVFEAMKLIARKPEASVTLRELADRVEVSPFHLCRSFRRLTGETITSYRHTLRLRAALETLGKVDDDLTSLALSLGYSSHSHFTLAFRRHFGVPPSAMRRSVSDAKERRPLACRSAGR